MEESDHSKLFVGGIPQETTEATLRDHFAEFGFVTETVIGRDRESGNARGFGFVAFSELSSVKKALDATHVILGKKVDVRKAIPRPYQNNQNRGFSSSRISNMSTDQIRNKKIFVGGLAPTITEEEFKGYFEQFGRITDVVVMYDNMTNRPRGFGFVTFDSEHAVEDVMQKNFHELGGKLVEVKVAIPKDENNNRSNDGLGGGRASHERGIYHYYPPYYGVMPGYAPFLGHGGPVVYPYGAHFYGGFYGGFGYGASPLVPRYPWSSPTMLGARESSWPQGNAATVYPGYLSGGVGNVGPTYSPGTTRLMNGNLNPAGGNNAVEAAEPVQGRGEVSV